MIYSSPNQLVIFDKMTSYDSKKIIYLTGASGQIGLSVRKMLANKDHKVVVNSRKKIDLHPNEIFNEYRLGDKIVPLEGYKEHIFFHLAHDFEDRRTGHTNVNLVGLRKIIYSFKSISRLKIIFISTPDVNNPRSTVYTALKRLAEDMLDKDKDLIIRPSLIYDKNGENGLSGVFGFFPKLIIPVPVNQSNIAPIFLANFSEKFCEYALEKQYNGVFLFKGAQSMSLKDYLRKYYELYTFPLANIFWLTLVTLFRLTNSANLFYLGERILGFIYLRDIDDLNDDDAIEVII